MGFLEALTPINYSDKSTHPYLMSPVALHVVVPPSAKFLYGDATSFGIVVTCFRSKVKPIYNFNDFIKKA